MAESYPRRNQARGLWKINDITKNITEEGTYPSGATRGVVCGGATPTKVSTIDFINIETTGNAADFGDLSTAKTYPAMGQVSSFTRGVVAGGSTPSYIDTIEYVQILSTGNAADFGNLTNSAGFMAGNSNNIRCVFGPRRLSPGASNVLDFITTATLGNATDFGDATANRRNLPGASNNTRGLIFGGEEGSTVNKIEFLELDISELQDAGASSEGGLNGTYTINFDFEYSGGSGNTGNIDTGP